MKQSNHIIQILSYIGNNHSTLTDDILNRRRLVTRHKVTKETDHYYATIGHLKGKIRKFL